LPDGWAARVRAEIRSGDLDDLLSAAEKISSKLGSREGEYRRWLKETIGTLQVRDSAVIDALQQLNLPIATTNYDDLIEKVTGWPSVTWRQENEIELVLRNEEQGVLHLHGYWRDPESVVLGIRSYESVLGDAHAQAILRALRTLRTLIFIGFGTGLADPNFSALRRWAAVAFSGSHYRHFRLVREGEVQAVQAEHDSDERIFAISYGKEYGDLAQFLNSLNTLPEPLSEALPHSPSVVSPANATGRTALSIPSYRWTSELSPAALLRAEYAVVPFFGRQQELEDITSWANSDDRLRIRLYVGEGGFGKTRLAIEACRRLGEAGFIAGFLPRKITDQGIARVVDELSRENTKAIIVIDYVEIDQQALVGILAMLRERRAGYVRILLLARGAGQWWDRLKRQRDGVGDLLTRPVTDEPLHIAPLGFSQRERSDLFFLAADAFGISLRLPVPRLSPDLRPEYFERVVLIHMAALMAVDGTDANGQDGILDRVLAREIGFWEELLLARKLDPALQDGLFRAMAAITLIKGVPDRTQALDVLRSLSFFAGEREPMLEAVAQVLHDAYGGRMWIDPLQPDLLGEHLVSKAFREYGRETFRKILGI
jgi:hypothetical protein